MRTVALEEHFTFPSLVSRIPGAAIRARGWGREEDLPAIVREVGSRLADLGQERLADMDAHGIDVQVLSLVGPGADLLPGADGQRFARDANDALAGVVAERPDRFAGFAHLPVLDPRAAADELARAVEGHGFVGALVSGTVDGAFLDHPRFAPLLSRAEALDVPLYLHPGIPPAAVRQAYYSGLAPAISNQLAQAGFGWHAETAIHVLRLALAGTLDAHPGLKLVIGHMGETLPVVLDRVDEQFAAEVSRRSARSVSQMLREQVWVTTSGLFTLPPLQALLAVFGVDRVLFSVDHPFASNAQGRAFLDQLPLAPSDAAKVAHGNADRLLGLVP